MGESHQHHFQQQSSSRLGLRNTGGEIVEVQGGHIVRSTGRKDRHSKVCTAKGPRDRRVRLSAHTAIQFYDVQDRLGYDRPSKAVDWLIKKAKAAIDELAELPAWNPSTIRTKSNNDAQQEQQQNQQDQQLHVHGLVDSLAVGGSSSRRATMEGSEEGSDQYGYQQHQHQHHHQHQQEQIENAQTNSHSQSFLPPSLDSDAIADTIKSFFPMGASADSSSSNSIHFHNYPPDLLSRTKSQNQDLRLSLQSFQDPMLMQSHHHQQHHHNQTHQSEQQALFSGGHTQLGFDAPPPAGWSEPNNQQAEIGRFQRMIAWNVGADSSSGNGSGSAGGGGFMFHSPQPPQVVLPQPSLQQLFGHNQFFSQRGPLQSSNSPSVRAWIDLPIAHQHHHQQVPSIHSSTVSGIGSFASGEFAGFRIPARIQGEEEHDGISNKPSSTSSDSRH